MNLGTLRVLLANCERQDAKVYINFGEPTQPVKIESWRGDYSEAAMTYSSARISDEDMTVEKAIAMIDEAYAKTHVGYKGGDYTFGPDTRVWVAEHGWSGNCSIERVIDKGWAVYIQTGFEEY